MVSKIDLMSSVVVSYVFKGKQEKFQIFLQIV
jgi:hypothetical protein